MGTIALDTAADPWIVSATGGALSLPLIITTDLVNIDRIEWFSPGAAQNDEAKITDSPPGVAAGSGRINWDVEASGADTYMWQRQLRDPPMRGLCVTALTSGTLRIFYA